MESLLLSIVQEEQDSMEYEYGVHFSDGPRPSDANSSRRVTMDGTCNDPILLDTSIDEEENERLLESCQAHLSQLAIDWDEDEGQDITPEDDIVISNTPHIKRQRTTFQQTLTQQGFVSRGEELLPKNTKATVKKEAGETWSSRKYPQLHYHISNIVDTEKGRFGVCCPGDVTKALPDTFIGEVQGKRLAKLWEGSRTNPGRVVLANTMTVLQRGKVPLHSLTKQHPTVGQPELWYEQGGSDKHGKSVFTCAYRYKDLDPPMAMPSKKIRVLDVFAGAGGMSLAFQNQGFEVPHKVEVDEMACAALKANFRDSTVFEETVESFLSQLGTKWYPKKGDVDHIHCSSVCDGFSSVNTGNGVNDKYNNKLSMKFVDLVRELQPATATFENVPGMLNSTKNKDKREYLDLIIAELLLLNYQVRPCILNASDYGDAQNRLRLILLVTRRDYKLPGDPTRTHGSAADVANGRREYMKRTCRDVLQCLEDVEPTQFGQVEMNGKRVLNHFQEGYIAHSKMTKLEADDQANTVRREAPFKHYSKERRLTVLEYALLQGYPASFANNLAGSIKDKRNQIGNGVPLGLGEAIARSVKESHEDYKKRYDIAHGTSVSS